MAPQLIYRFRNAVAFQITMMLFWGESYTCFFNDAYQKSFTHESTAPNIGDSGKDAFPEIWESLKPTLAAILTNSEAEKPLSIFLNGTLFQSFNTIFDENHDPVGVLSIGNQNISIRHLKTAESQSDLIQTQQKKLKAASTPSHDLPEQALSREQLKILLLASGLRTWELDVRPEIGNGSERFSEIIERSDRPDFNNNAVKKQIHPDDLEKIKRSFESAIKKGKLQFTGRMILPDGTLSWIESKGKVFYDDQKIPTVMIGTTRDVTEEKLKQQSLFKSEQKFRLLADSMPQQIWTADTFGNLNYYNQSAFNYSGLNFKDFLTTGWLDIIHPDDRAECIESWLKAMETGRDFIVEHRSEEHTS